MSEESLFKELYQLKQEVDNCIYDSTDDFTEFLNCMDILTELDGTRDVFAELNRVFSKEDNCKCDSREILTKLNSIFLKVEDLYLKLREDVLDLVMSIIKEDKFNPDFILEAPLRNIDICKINNSNRFGRMEPVEDNIKSVRFLNGNLNCNVFKENDYDSFRDIVKDINQFGNFLVVSPLKTANSFEQLIQRLGKKDNSKRFSGFMLENEWFNRYYYPLNLSRNVEKKHLPNSYHFDCERGFWAIENGKFLYVKKEAKRQIFYNDLQALLFLEHDQNGKIIYYDRRVGDGYVIVSITPAKNIQKEILELNVIGCTSQDYFLDGFFEHGKEIYYFIYFIYTG